MGACCSSGEVSPARPPQPRPKACTDLLWLVLFVLFWILTLQPHECPVCGGVMARWRRPVLSYRLRRPPPEEPPPPEAPPPHHANEIIVSAFSFVYGNPLRIINGFDSFGNTCGVKNNQKFLDFPLAGIDTYDKPYLFFMDVKELQRSLKICVKQCPTENIDSLDKLKAYYLKTGSNLCRYDVPVDKLDASRKDLNHYIGPCPTLPVYESFPLLNRCVPKPAKEVAQKIFTDFYDLLNSWDTIEQMLSDLYSSWKEMTICVIIAFIVSLVMVSILHLLATLVSFIFMIVVSITSVVGTGLLWYTYYELKTGRTNITNSFYLSETLRNEKAFLWYSIIATVITVILLLLVWVMRSRVSFLAALFKETAHCLGSIPGLFLQPIITFFFLVLFFAYWSLVVVCLATANYPGIPYHTNFLINGTPAPILNENSAVQLANDKSASLKTYTLDSIEFDPSWVKGMWWVCLISLIWTSEFIIGCQQMTIAGAVSHWYFRGQRANSSPVLFSIGKLIKYHMGSVAKGSFLITLFKIPRLIMMYMYAKLKSRADKGSDCAKCGLKCGICCFYCLEKFIKFLNHNAYTIITIERVHFCKAAGIAFNTLVNNALQVATINSVGDFILFLGKCIVTAITGSLGLLMLKRNPDLHFFAVPTLVICIFSFFIAHCMLSLYEMVVDTLFLCVCEDRNLNGDDGRWKSSGLVELGEGVEVARRKYHGQLAATQVSNETENLQEPPPDKF